VIAIPLPLGSELPPYTVRVSARARRVRLVVTPREGLVVVVPKRWRGDPETVVAEQREWAERALAHVAPERALFAAGAEALLPDLVELRIDDERWPVEYRTTGATGVRAKTDAGALVLSGAVGDADACLSALTRWLDRTSRERLLPMLERVADDAGIAYAGARVRRQRSRWGSCSARRTLSLNRNLVFLPDHLVRSLMLHELAHTQVMDHSARFWTALERLDPDAHLHRSQMKGAARFVPPWADA
jgi:predicted metal-dependent hydrolase